jgi:hypothetical protein
MREEVRQFIENKKNNLNSITCNVTDKITKPIMVRIISDARRLLTKLICKLQTGEITGQNAKDMTYLLISLVSIIKEGELEAKLNALEERMNEMKSLER